MIIVAPGSLSDGLTTRVFPVTVARAADHKTILMTVSIMQGTQYPLRGEAGICSHGGEVEWGDGGSHSQGDSSGVCVHVTGDFQLISHECGCDSSRALDHLQTSLNIAQSVCECFTLFEYDGFGNLWRMFSDQVLQSEYEISILCLCSVLRPWLAHSKMILCLRMILVFDHVLNASEAALTAALNSASVVSGTVFTTT
jgi:hypothetical protein